MTTTCDRNVDVILALLPMRRKLYFHNHAETNGPMFTKFDGKVEHGPWKKTINKLLTNQQARLLCRDLPLLSVHSVAEHILMWPP